MRACVRAGKDDSKEFTNASFNPSGEVVVIGSFNRFFIYSMKEARRPAQRSPGCRQPRVAQQSSLSTPRARAHVRDRWDQPPHMTTRHPALAAAAAAWPPPLRHALWNQ